MGSSGVNAVLPESQTHSHEIWNDDNGANLAQIALMASSNFPHYRMPAFRLAEGVRLLATDMLREAFQGLARRKNKFPAGDVMVMLLVPLLVLMK